MAARIEAFLNSGGHSRDARDMPLPARQVEVRAAGRGTNTSDFLNLPPHSKRPRSRGLTHVIDKGLTLCQIEGLFHMASDYIDVVKLGWGTSYVTHNLRDKVALYRSFMSPVVCGGTLFEAAFTLDKLDDYRHWLTRHGFTHVEVSDGTIWMNHECKLHIISELAKDFVVFSEVGTKDPTVDMAPSRWIECIQAEIAAGASKVITEGRETGNAGIFRSTGELRTKLGGRDHCCGRCGIHHFRGADPRIAVLVDQTHRSGGELGKHQTGRSRRTRDPSPRPSFGHLQSLAR